MIILIFGDVVGRAGRAAIREFLATYRKDHAVDFIIANGENLAHGKGITDETAEELFAAGVNLLTTGNHVWDIRKAQELLQKDTRIIRPANFPPGTAGRGWTTATVGMTTIAVLNLMGRVFFREDLDDPFRAAEAWLKELPRVQPLITLVDMHAEATSEKRAIAEFLDGKVTAIWGTHTHVVTADERILPRGTAYLTDLGMCGALHSILGFSIPPLVERFRTQLSTPFNVEEEGPREVNALRLDIDERSGRVQTIERLRSILDPLSA